MILLPFPLGASPRILVRTYACLGLIGATCVVQAAEGFKLRQPPFGLFGGELAAPLDNSGFFGTASLTYSRIEKLVDGAGNNMTVSPRSIPLPTGTPTGGVIPNGTYTLSYGPGNIDIRQSQATLNLVGGYLTETEYAAGHLAFAVNVPLIKQSRSFTATQFGAVSPIPPLPCRCQSTRSHPQSMDRCRRFWPRRLQVKMPKFQVSAIPKYLRYGYAIAISLRLRQALRCTCQPVPMTRIADRIQARVTSTPCAPAWRSAMR